MAPVLTDALIEGLKAGKVCGVDSWNITAEPGSRSCFTACHWLGHFGRRPCVHLHCSARRCRRRLRCGHARLRCHGCNPQHPCNCPKQVLPSEAGPTIPGIGPQKVAQFVYELAAAVAEVRLARRRIVGTQRRASAALPRPRRPSRAPAAAPAATAGLQPLNNSTRVAALPQTNPGQAGCAPLPDCTVGRGHQQRCRGGPGQRLLVRGRAAHRFSPPPPQLAPAARRTVRAASALAAFAGFARQRSPPPPPQVGQRAV